MNSIYIILLFLHFEQRFKELFFCFSFVYSPVPKIRRTESVPSDINNQVERQVFGTLPKNIKVLVGNDIYYILCVDLHTYVSLHLLPLPSGRASTCQPTRLQQ